MSPSREGSSLHAGVVGVLGALAAIVLAAAREPAARRQLALEAVRAARGILCRRFMPHVWT
jgi:hypothetical protein